MIYQNTGATVRHDVNALVMQAVDVEPMFIARKVLPPIPMPAKAGQYPKFTIEKSDLLKANDNTKRAPGAAYNRIDQSFEMDSYVCVDRGLTQAIDDGQELEYAQYFDMEVVAAKNILRNQMIAAEARAKDALFNTSTFNSTSATVAYTTATLATIDFDLDLSAALERLSLKGVIPNTLVLNKALFNLIARAPKLLAQVTTPTVAGQVRRLSVEDLKSIYGLDFVIAAAPRDTAKTKQTPSLSYIWPSTYMWIGKVQGGECSAGGAGRTIFWSPDSDEYTTETYRDEEARSNIVRVRQHSVEKVIDSSCGELIATGA